MEDEALTSLNKMLSAVTRVFKLARHDISSSVYHVGAALGHTDMRTWDATTKALNEYAERQEQAQENGEDDFVCSDDDY